MAVLTIARELGAIVRGEELILCNKLDLRCISKATLEERFAALGLSSDFLRRFDECKPGLVSSMTNSPEYFWETLRTAVMQELLQDNIALLGRGGNFLLHDVTQCLRIRLVAGIDFRIRQVAREYAVSDAEARKMVQQSDSARSKFCEYYYGKDWRDPANYDLVINTEFIEIDEIAGMIYPLLPSPVPEVDKEELQLLVQAQIIKHTLFQLSELQLRFPNVICAADGVVTLQGTVASEAAKRRAGEIVSSIPGVKELHNELAVVLRDIPNRLPPMMH